MDKDFNTWNSRKISLNDKEFIPFFHDREIWWCSVGVNVGHEVDGKNQHFERPVLITRAFSRDLFWGIPLTSKHRLGKYQAEIQFSNHNSTIMLTQLRLFSSKRLLRRIGILDKVQYKQIKLKIQNLFE